MTPDLAASIWLWTGVYAAIGAVVALIFLIGPIKAVSAGARTAAPLQFRLLIFPGCVALWPLIAVRMLLALVRGGRDATSA